MVDAAAIAAEVAARYGVAVCPSVVQVCPPRTFSEVTPVWDGRTRTLVYPDAEARKAQFKKAIWAGAAKARAAAVDPAIAARRDAVMQLHATGQSVPAIMAALQIKYHIVIQDLGKLGLKPNAYATDAMTQAEVKADRIKQLHGEGWAVAGIAAHLGVVADTVRDLAWKHHGIRFARKAAKARVPKPPKVKTVRLPKPKKTGSVRVAAILAEAAQRRARAVDLLGQGITQAAIAVMLGVSQRQIRRDCRDAGEAPLKAGRWREKLAVAA